MKARSRRPDGARNVHATGSHPMMHVVDPMRLNQRDRARLRHPPNEVLCTDVVRLPFSLPSRNRTPVAASTSHNGMVPRGGLD